jgi:hypothetical protein
MYLRFPFRMRPARSFQCPPYTPNLNRVARTDCWAKRRLAMSAQHRQAPAHDGIIASALRYDVDGMRGRWILHGDQSVEKRIPGLTVPDRAGEF